MTRHPVYRAPMRSRHDDVDHQATIDRALALGLCGFGGVLRPAPRHVASAAALAARQHDERLARRIERFAAVAVGSFVWTRDEDRSLWVGRITGALSYDSSTGAAEVDLVHVRPCEWSETPVVEHNAPAAVLATFRRGGRNFQQIHDPAVGSQTRRAWAVRG